MSGMGVLIFRHCERSEAIQDQKGLDCFVASLLAMTNCHSFFPLLPTSHLLTTADSATAEPQDSSVTLFSGAESSHIPDMAKTPDSPKKSGKSPSKTPKSKAHRPDVQPIGPALAELLNPAINRGDAGMGSGTGLQPPPDNSWDRRAGGEAAAHRARASTKGFEEAPQANYGTAATIPTLDPELARQLGLPTAEDDEEALARPPRSKMEALGVKATADALESLIRDGRPEFKGEDGQVKIWTPHRPPRPEKSEGGQSVRHQIRIRAEGRPADRDRRTGRGHQPQRPHAGAARGHRLGQDLHHGESDRGDAAPGADPRAEQDARRPALWRVQEFLPRQRGRILRLAITTTTSPRPMCRGPTPISRRTSSINEQIDRMRHSATRALLERDDVIIVASVSCIYGIGSVETYTAMTFALKKGERIDQRQLIADLVALQYKRTQADFTRGTFRVRGDVIDIFPAHYEDRAWRVNLFGDTVENIEEFDPLTGHKQDELEFIKIYANSHYVTPRPTLVQAIKSIKGELKLRLDQLNNQGRLLEAQRLEQRTTFDLEMMEATGSCAGIENYSRYLTGRRPGEPPPTLFEYVPDNALVFADESHVTIPQIGGMFRGDFRRKATLAEYGFRLPSCMDNRPLRFEEWDMMRPQSVAVSATPSGWELNESGGVFVEQVIRPTGLIDPPVDIRPARTQVDDLVGEVRAVAQTGLSLAGHGA